MTTWHCYSITPIDYGWDYLPTANKFASDRGTEEEMKVYKRLLEALDIGRLYLGWEGDFNTEPHVFVVPNDTEFHYGFVWKHSNNGNTFVVSPVILPHLTNVTFVHTQYEGAGA